MKTVAQALCGNSYPGRGIILGASACGSVAAYFIMGRSQNSRNRVFVPEGGGIRTQAHDPGLLTDPSLIIYWPVRVYENTLIVTNGDQTDTVYDHLSRGSTFEAALRTRAFEPDGPHFTPRISGLLTPAGYSLSILKNDGAGGCQRQFFEYPFQNGVGHLIHTYKGDGQVLPPFEGEPVPLALEGPIDDLARLIWSSLDEQNRVALFVRAVDQEGLEQTRVINALG